MRVVVIIVAALFTLGLAAFGVVAAQRGTSPVLANLFQPHAASPISVPQAAPVPKAASAAPSSPVTQVAQATATMSDAPQPAAAEPAVTAPTAPTHMAQNSGPVTPDRFNPPPGPTAAPSPAAPQQLTAAPVHPIPACDKPDAIGLSRIVEIDTTGGPAFGTEHFKQYDFLRDHEVVLTFDDGPWKGNTPAVIKALQDNCTKATFFEIGEHATWYPEISKMVEQAGMTIGTHTWSHKDLARNPYAKDIEQAKQEIEMGVSAVHMAADGPIAPFFRFPDLQQPADLIAYLGSRNISTFSADIDTVDFKLNKPDAVIKSVMTKLAKNGKGILLMHDFKPATAEAMPELLRQLKAGGYKIVHMVPKSTLTTISKYDDMVRAQDKFSNANNTRPESSVVKTINE
jgi:peptidoglycan/xylan/chitin deacetylase (PgdA/CDA1 family)